MIRKSQNASLIFHVIKLSETVRKYGDVMTQQYGITTQQWLIMLLLAKDPNIVYFKDNPQDMPLLAKELAEAMNVSRANITNLLNVLMKKKLVTQVHDGNDKRRKRLTLTREGDAILASIEPIRHKNNNRLLNNFTKEEKDVFIAFIQHALQILKKDVGEKK
jgi:DNA-binding MarR family transcriptional regulator